MNHLAGIYTDVSAFIDHLPNLFSQNLNVSAFKIADDNNNFLGAMYDSRRISTSAYKDFLKAKLSRDGLVFQEYRSLFWQSKTRKLKITTLYLPMASFADYTRFFLLAGIGFSACVSLFIFAGLIICMIVYHVSHPPQSKQLLGIRPKVTRQATANKTETSSTIQLDRNSTSSILSENRIRKTMDELRSITQSPHIGFYMRQENEAKFEWKGILELRNELVIRGDSIAIPGLLNLAHVPENRGVIHSTDNKQWFISNDNLEKASVLFSLGFEAETKLTSEQCKKGLSIVKSQVREMQIERNYEQAILDQLTGLYAAPYAFFSIREKIQNGTHFSVTYLKFADNLSEDNLKTVSHFLLKVARSHYDASEAPLIARLEMSQFIIVQNINKESSTVGRDLFHEQLYTFGNQTSQLKLAIGVVSDAFGFSDLKTLLRMLDSLAEKSFAQKKVVDLESSSRIGVI